MLQLVVPNAFASDNRRRERRMSLRKFAAANKCLQSSPNGACFCVKDNRLCAQTMERRRLPAYLDYNRGRSWRKSVDVKKGRRKRKKIALATVNKKRQRKECEE